MDKFLVLILVMCIFSNYVVQESVAKIPLKKTDEIRCSYMYEKFKKSGEEKLVKRYPFYPIMDICLKLYHDPNWNFAGKNLIDKKYQSDLVSVIKPKVLST